MELHKIWQVPNLLSLSRVVLIIPIAYYLNRPGPVAELNCLMLIALAGVTDGLDGYLARRLNQVSRLGIALDPIADKVFAAGLILLLIPFRGFPVWLAALVVGRDLAIMGLGAILLRGRTISLPSNLTGKYTFSVVVVLIASYIVRFEFGIVMTTLLLVPLILLSGVNYYKVFRAVRSGRKLPRFQDKPVYLYARLVSVLALSTWFLWEFFIHML